MFKKSYNGYLLITIFSVVAFFLFLGRVHLFDWDEINFAESSREMLISGDYFHVQINYEMFWEKPPLFMWLQSTAMQIFGDNEFSARLPNALCGAITLLVLFHIGKKHFDYSFALLWSFIYAMSILPHMYFKSGIIDPVFNLFIFLSIYQIIQCLNNNNKTKNAIYGGMFAGFAFLTKGPVAFILIGLTYFIYQITVQFKNIGKIKLIALFVFSLITVSSIWVLPEIMKNGFSTLKDFIAYQYRLLTTGDAGHEQPFYYHFVVVFIGCFPMSVFSQPLFTPGKFSSKLEFTKWMVILFWVVMILFTIVKTKIVHYSSMCWLPLSFCSAQFIYTKFNEGNTRNAKYVFLVGGILFSILLMGLPLLGHFRESIVPMVNDKFAVAAMRMPVDWPLWLTLGGILFLLGIFISFNYLRKNNILFFSFSMLTSTTTALLFTLFFIVPKIEKHSQGPAIEFLEKHKNEKVYVFPLGYKSYAHYYYFKVPNENNELRKNEEYLVYGKIDRPTYFITKINNDFLKDKKDIKLIGAKGGFKFYLRAPADLQK